MAIGARWDDRIAGKLSEFCKCAAKIHVVIDVAELNKIVCSDAAIAADAKLAIKNRHWLSSGGAGTMGFGFPSAIGAAMATGKPNWWAMAHEDGPCLIEVEVVKANNVFPMIPAGAALSEMIIEEPKEKMEKSTGST